MFRLILLLLWLIPSMGMAQYKIRIYSHNKEAGWHLEQKPEAAVGRFYFNNLMQVSVEKDQDFPAEDKSYSLLHEAAIYEKPTGFLQGNAIKVLSKEDSLSKAHFKLGVYKSLRLIQAKDKQEAQRIHKKLQTLVIERKGQQYSLQGLEGFQEVLGHRRVDEGPMGWSLSQEKQPSYIYFSEKRPIELIRVWEQTTVGLVFAVCVFIALWPLVSHAVGFVLAVFSGLLLFYLQAYVTQGIALPALTILLYLALYNPQATLAGVLLIGMPYTLSSQYLFGNHSGLFLLFLGSAAAIVLIHWRSMLSGMRSHPYHLGYLAAPKVPRWFLVAIIALATIPSIQTHTPSKPYAPPTAVRWVNANSWENLPQKGLSSHLATLVQWKEPVLEKNSFEFRVPYNQGTQPLVFSDKALMRHLLGVILLLAVFFGSLRRAFTVAMPSGVFLLCVHFLQFPHQSLWSDVNILIVLLSAVVAKVNYQQLRSPMTEVRETQAQTFSHILLVALFFGGISFFHYLLGHFVESALWYIATVSSAMLIFVLRGVRRMKLWAFKATLRLKMLVLASLLLCFPSQLLGNTASTDCQVNATVILPIHGRPRGKEPPPRNPLYREKLAQDVRCALLLDSLESNIIELLTSNNRPYSEIAKLVAENYTQIVQEANLLNQAVFPKSQLNNVSILFGYYEEFFSSYAFTIGQALSERTQLFIKFTSSEINTLETLADAAQRLTSREQAFLQEILGEQDKYPIYLEPVENLDKDALGQDLSNELDLFLQSRFRLPFEQGYFERKHFFFPVDSPSEGKYRVNVKIRRYGTKIMASINVYDPVTGRVEKTWVQENIAQLAAFESTVFRQTRSLLLSLESIHDYALMFTLGVQEQDASNRFYGIVFRQNLGNAANTVQLLYMPNPNLKTTAMFALDLSFGWQFLDYRWLSADTGLALGGSLFMRKKESEELGQFGFYVGLYGQSILVLAPQVVGFARGDYQLWSRASNSLPDTSRLVSRTVFQLGLGYQF